VAERESRPLPNDPPPWRLVLRKGRAERLWRLVEVERTRLADRVDDLAPAEWDAPSRCDGWRVRDVLGHLVHMAESTAKSINQDLRASGGRDRDKGFSVCARERGGRPVPELTQRLRTAAASRYNGMPGVALIEVVVHGDDMLAPLGRRLTFGPDVLRACLDQMRWVDRLAARFAFHGRSHRNLRLVATDLDWAVGRGPEVRGQALDLMALLSNRAGAAAALSGPGALRLAGG